MVVGVKNVLRHDVEGENLLKDRTAERRKEECAYAECWVS